MSWTKKNVHPGKIVSTSQEVEVIVLDVDSAKRRISLGLKQAQNNPWEAFVEAHPIGSTVEGEVKNATEFGLFVGLDNDIDGMVHLSDLDWNVSGEEAIQRYRKGETIKAKVLDVDIEKERVSLGVKQLGGDPMEGDVYKRGQQITVTVTSIETGGIEVKFGEDDAPVTAFVRKSDLSRDRNEQRPERFAVGDRIDAMITGIDKATRRVSVSVKALEMKDEAEAIDRQIRACTPHPGAWTELFAEGPIADNDESTAKSLALHILAAQPADQSNPNTPAELQPGELKVGKKNVWVGTGSTPLELTQVKAQGKKAMRAADWARGARLSPAACVR